MTIDLFDFRYCSAGGRYDFSNFKITDSNGNDILANGEVTYSVSRFFSQTGNFEHQWDTSVDSLIYQVSAGTIELTDSQTYFSYCVACWSSAISQLGGTQVLRTPITGSHSLTVKTVVDFENNISAGDTFTVGKLVIEADDGSRIELNADNGIPTEVDIAVVSNKKIVHTTEPWHIWIYDWNFQIPSPIQQLSYAQRATLPDDC